MYALPSYRTINRARTSRQVRRRIRSICTHIHGVPGEAIGNLLLMSLLLTLLIGGCQNKTFHGFRGLGKWALRLVGCGKHSHPH